MILKQEMNVGEYRLTCEGCGALTNDVDEHEGKLLCSRCRNEIAVSTQSKRNVNWKSPKSVLSYIVLDLIPGQLGQLFGRFLG